MKSSRLQSLSEMRMKSFKQMEDGGRRNDARSSEEAQSEKLQKGFSQRGFAGSQDRTMFIHRCTVQGAIPPAVDRNKIDQI